MSKPRNKCHGNRKLQRFRKKCYKRGLTKEQTQKLIDEYNRTSPNTNNHGDIMEVDTNEEIAITSDFNDNINGNRTAAVTTTTKKSKKRKQPTTPKSSQQSTSHSLVKRIKKTKSSQIRITPIKPYYRLPIYLQVYPNLLFRTLSLQLKHTLKKKNERRFLHHRLQLLDEQHRLQLRKNLWQEYLTLGFQQQVWPVSANL